MGKIDPIKVINTIYFEETRSVPYPIFMNCFDRLLQNPPDLQPAEPSEDLEPWFRAVCLALDRGIADPERRGEDRKQEFYEHIYPVWKEALGKSGFQPYQEILDGKVHERMARRERQQSEDDQPGARQGFSPEQRHARFESALHDALAASSRMDAREEARIPTEPAKKAESEKPQGKSAGGKIPVAKNIEALIAAIEKKIIPIKYNDIDNRRPCARYYLGSTQVSVKFIRTGNSYYCTLLYPRGISDRDAVEDALLAVTSRMGYAEKESYTYVNNKKDNYKVRIKIGQRSIYIASGRPEEFTMELLLDALRTMHNDLVRLVNELGLSESSQD